MEKHETSGSLFLDRAMFLSGSTILGFLTAGLFIILALANDSFLSAGNIRAISLSVAIQTIAIVGFVYVMICGHIDLSVGAIYALAGTLCGWLMTQWNFDLWLSVPIAICVAALAGALNGFLVSRFKINSLMLTIGTMILFKGIMGVLAVDLLGNVYTSDFRALAKFRIYGFPASICLALTLIVALAFLEKGGGYFRRMYLVGESAPTAEVYGIRSSRVIIQAYIASAVFAGVAGIISASRITHASTTMGAGLEFLFVTAAVLGGASLYGGRGSVVGSAVGLIFLALVSNGLVVLRVDPLAQQVIVGVFLICAVLIDVVVRNRGSVQ